MRPVDVQEALADLTSISSQLETAVISTASGDVLASTISEQERSRRIVATAQELLAAASQARPSLGTDAVTQVEAATPAGSVFVVRDERRSIVATTTPEPTTGLVLYDLRSCLRSLAESDEASRAEAEGAEKPQRRTGASTPPEQDAGS